MPAFEDSKIVGAYEAKTHLSELLEKVEAGEEITITKHGTPIARLVPIKKRQAWRSGTRPWSRFRSSLAGFRCAV